MKIVLIFLLTLSSAYGETLSTLFDKAQKSSPFLKPLNERDAMLGEAERLTTAYHLPSLVAGYSYTKTNSPMMAFGQTMMQEKFTTAAFMNEKKVNNPDWSTNQKIDFGVVLPVDLAGRVRTQSAIVKKEGEVAGFDKIHQTQKIKVMIMSELSVLESLGRVKEFLKSEILYLEKIIQNYDGRSSENKNRYLTYNQARIIKEHLMASLKSVEASNEVHQRNLNFIIGEVVDFKSLPSIAYAARRPVNLEKRPELISLSKNLEVASLQIKKERSDLLPELNLYAMRSRSTEDWKTHGDDSTVGLELKWRFGLDKKRSVDFASAKKRVEEATYQLKKQEIEQNLFSLEREVDQLAVDILSMENQDLIYKENKKILTEQYQRGSVDLYNMLDNFVRYIENYSMLENKKIVYKSKIAELSLLNEGI